MKTLTSFKTWRKWIGASPPLAAGTAALLAFWALSDAAYSADGGVTPPDLTVCEGQECEALPEFVCSAAGFKITLAQYTPASQANSGTASYTYEICSPAEGTCNGTARPGEPCLDDSFCKEKGTAEDPTATCSRECSVNDFHGLSHFDVTFPQVGGTESCVSTNPDENTVTGSCAVSTDAAPSGASVGNFVEGDGSCFDGATSSSFVAKCDNTNLGPGDCITMTVNIAGESTELGFGAAIVVDKESNTCTASCIAGPSCERCDTPEEPGDECLTRTLGFWGTHPWITNDYVAVTVCGQSLTCDGSGDGKSNPSCGYGTCNDVMEGLGSSPGQEGGGNSAYVALVKQLTAAKLNLNATAAVTDGSCGSFEYEGKTIAEWLAICDIPSLCDANQATISSSGCIEALNAFNNSEDVLDSTPAPFDRPPVDDYGNVSGADSSAFTAAQGNHKKTKLVVGKGSCASP